MKYLFDDERNENGFELLADYAEAYSCADGQVMLVLFYQALSSCKASSLAAFHAF